jgi:hypothetical protein
LAFKDKKYAGYIVGAMMAIVAFYTTKPHQWYNTDLTYMISALVLVLALARKQYVGAAILVVATLGTDTAWLKLFPAVLCLLPVTAAEYNVPVRRYLFAVMTFFCAVVVWRMTTNSIGQSNLTQTDTIASVAPYKGIAIRQAEQQRMLQYKTDVDSLRVNNQQSSILAIGQENHLMRAVTGCEAAKYNEFWSNIFDSVYTDKYRQVIREQRPIVLCSFSPQFKTKSVYKDKESCMENMLREEGYREIDRSKFKYMIYIPENDTEVQ